MVLPVAGDDGPGGGSHGGHAHASFDQQIPTSRRSTPLSVAKSVLAQPNELSRCFLTSRAYVFWIPLLARNGNARQYR